MERFRRFFPPGWNYRMELRFYGFWLLGSAVFSLQFLVKYCLNYQKLFSWRQGELVYNGGGLIGFSQMLEGCFLGFWILPLLMLLAALFHYFYYYQGSRSIYLIRRLPDRWYVFKSCVLLPFLGTVLSLGLQLLLTLLYAICYVVFAPKIGG